MTDEGRGTEIMLIRMLVMWQRKTVKDDVSDDVAIWREDRKQC